MCRGKKITCPGARDKLNFRQEKHIFSLNVRRASEKSSARLFDNMFWTSYLATGQVKIWLYLPGGQVKILRFFYPWCVKMRELHCPAKTEQNFALEGWHSANALVLLFQILVGLRFLDNQKMTEKWTFWSRILLYWTMDILCKWLHLLDHDPDNFAPCKLDISYCCFFYQIDSCFVGCTDDVLVVQTRGSTGL